MTGIMIRPRAVVLALTLAAVTTATAQDDTRFIRFSKGKVTSRLETANVTYENLDTGTKIILVSAVHVADASYFQAVQKTLDAADVVLFEDVKPDADGEPPPTATWVVRLQLLMRDYLGLEQQTDHVDTTKPGFVHADLTYEQIETMLEEREVQVLPYSDVLKSLGPVANVALNWLKKRAQETEKGSIYRKMQTRLKKTLGELLGSGLRLYDRFKTTGDKKRDEVIIAARNKVVFDRLVEVASAGEARTIAVFYGAAHMADFEKRLQEKWPRIRKTGTMWIPAWTIGGAKTAAPKDANGKGKKI